MYGDEVVWGVGGKGGEGRDGVEMGVGMMMGMEWGLGGLG